MSESRKSQYRRFQMKFTSEDDAASFIRLVQVHICAVSRTAVCMWLTLTSYLHVFQVVCPVAPAPNSGAMAKPSPVSGAGTADVLAMTQIAHIDEENSQLAIRSLAGAERVQQLDPSLPFPSSTPTMLAATPLTSSPHMAIPRTPFPHLTSATVPAVSSGDVRLGSRPQSNVARQGSGVSVDTQTAGKRPLPEQDAATKAPAKKPRARAPPKAKVPAKGKRKNKPLDLAPAASADTQEHAVQAVVSRSPSRQTPAPAQLQLQAQPVESHTQRSATITQSIPTSRSAQGQLVLQPQPLENYGAFTSSGQGRSGILNDFRDNSRSRPYHITDYNRSGMGPNVHHDSSGGLNFTHELPTQYYPVARSYVATRSAAQPSPATLQPSQGPADQLQNGALRYHQPHPHSDQAQMYESHSSRACATTSSVRELFAMSDRELEETATRIMLDEGFPEVVSALVLKVDVSRALRS